MTKLSRIIIPLLLMASAFCREAIAGADSLFVPVVKNVRGDTLPLSSILTGKTVVIFYSTYSCADCFIDITSELDTLSLHDSSIRRIGLVRSEDDVFSRRIVLADARRLLPRVDGFFFDMKEGDVEDPWPPVGLRGGLFGYFGVVRTPAMLIVDSSTGAYTFIPYDELFVAKGERTVLAAGRLRSLLNREL